LFDDDIVVMSAERCLPTWSYSSLFSCWLSTQFFLLSGESRCFCESTPLWSNH